MLYVAPLCHNSFKHTCFKSPCVLMSFGNINWRPANDDDEDISLFSAHGFNQEGHPVLCCTLCTLHSLIIIVLGSDSHFFLSQDGPPTGSGAPEGQLQQQMPSKWNALSVRHNACHRDDRVLGFSLHTSAVDGSHALFFFLLTNLRRLAWLQVEGIHLTGFRVLDGFGSRDYIWSD